MPALLDRPEPTLAELNAKRELAAALKRKALLKDNNGLAFYTPHEKQDAFHRAGRFRMRYVRTGNRFGKSTCGAAEDIAWCLGERPWYSEGDPARYEGIPQTPVKGVLLVADWDKAEEIFTSQERGDRKGKLFQLLPTAALVKIEKNQAGYIAKLVIKSKWGGDSALYIDTVKSFSANPMGHESSDWDFVHVDEPLPKNMWTAYSRGLADRNGAAWFCCTPITELWINDEFIPSNRIRDTFDSGFVNSEDPKNKTWIITGSIYDNKTLDPQGVDRFVKTLPKDEYAARVEGRPKQLAGIIYKDFDPQRHIFYDKPHGWEDISTPPKDWTIRVAIDPHPKTPHAVLFAATGPSEQTFFWCEIFMHCYTRELCEEIKLRLGDLEPVSIICDPIAWIEHPNTGETMADDFQKNGVQVWPAPKDLSRGILQTGEMLRKNDPRGFPMLQFSHMLERTIYEFDRYVWDPKKESPQADCSDHFMENLYRLVIGGLFYIPPEKQSPNSNRGLRVIDHADMSLPSLPKAPPIPGLLV